MTVTAANGLVRRVREADTAAMVWKRPMSEFFVFGRFGER